MNADQPISGYSAPDPDEAKSYAVMALTHLQEGRPDAAVRALRQAASAASGDAEALFLVATAQFVALDLTGARRVLNEGLSLAPDLAAGRLLSSAVFLAEHEFSAGREELTTAAKLGAPEDAVRAIACLATLEEDGARYLHTPSDPTRAAELERIHGSPQLPISCEGAMALRKSLEAAKAAMQASPMAAQIMGMWFDASAGAIERALEAGTKRVSSGSFGTLAGGMLVAAVLLLARSWPLAVLYTLSVVGYMHGSLVPLHDRWWKSEPTPSGVAQDAGDHIIAALLKGLFIPLATVFAYVKNYGRPSREPPSGSMGAA